MAINNKISTDYIFKKILIISIIFLIIGFTAFICKITITKKTNGIERTLLNKFITSIKTNNVISQNELKTFYEDNKNIRFLYNKDLKYIAVYKYPSQFKGKLNPNKEDVKYIYPSLNNLNTELKNDGYISNAGTSCNLKVNGTKYLIELGFRTPTYNYGASAILNFIIVAAISLYWILFGIWATMNARNEGSYNTFLFLSFFLFNILGYFIYKSHNRNKLKNSM